MFVGDGYRAKNEELGPLGLPFACAGNVNGDFNFKEADRFPEDNLDRVGNKVSKPNDVAFTSKGTVGRIAFVRLDTPRFVYSPQLCFWGVLDKNIIDQKFLYFWMLGREFYLQCRAAKGQTDMADYVNLQDQRRMKITLPPLPERCAIACILSSLDDKIEVNRRMNETLEAMARTLFKSWFIDFDPVHARVEGRAPAGMDAETAALFPDGFEETELGMVPRGWGIGSFDETIDLIGGGTPKTPVPEYWNGNTPWFSIVDAPENSNVFVIDTEKKITQRGLEETSTRLLLKGTTIITARGTVGKCALVGNPMTMNQSCYGIHAKDQRCDYFIYFALRNLVSELQRSTHGSVFDTISSNTFKTVYTVIVPVELTRIFDKKISSFMERILSSLQESETLVLPRNALLLKLLSGEIRLKYSGMLKEAKQWT